MQPLKITIAPDAASATKVAAAQTTTGTAALVLTAAATSGIDSSGAARILLFTTTSDVSLVDVVIVGTDANGVAISETLALPDNTTKPSVLAYKTVTSITPTGTIAADISVGTTNTTLSVISKILVTNPYSRVPAQIAAVVTGTINFTVQETFDTILSGTPTLPNATFFDITALAAKTSNTHAQGSVGQTGIKLQISSYSSGATIVLTINTPSNSDEG